MSTIHESVYMAEGAVIHGKDITIGEDCSIWCNAVIRQSDSPVVIGARTNVQDNCVIHTDLEGGTIIGHDVTIGHSAIVHGCTVGDYTLIGMGAIVLSGAKIGNNCVIGAGALVTGRTEVPDGHMALGSPAKVIRPLTEEEIAGLKRSAEHYVAEAREAMKTE